VVVSRLRRALEGALLVTRKPGYVLDMDPEALDARRFERLVEQARQLAATDPPRASSLLGEALGLWRGPALAEFAFEPFAQEAAAQLELQGMLARRRGAYEEAVAAYEEALGVIRDLELREEVPFLLVDLGNLHVLLGDVEAAAVLHKEALALALELGARDTAAHARNGLGLAARRQGHFGRARELHLEALSFFREAGCPGSRADVVCGTGSYVGSRASLIIPGRHLRSRA
jgi:tetratricopeptide (TPR) repeat protein